MKAFWLVWDGTDSAVLGRNGIHVIEVAARVQRDDIFVVSAHKAKDHSVVLLDFFWASPHRAFIRPFLLPRETEYIEVAALVSGRPETVARYYLDREQDNGLVSYAMVFAQIVHDRREPAPICLVMSQEISFGEVETRLAALQRHPSRTLVWAVAVPFQDSSEGDIVERRVGPLVMLFPRAAGLISVVPARYREEKEDSESLTPRADEPAIAAVSRELRHVISLDIEALAEMSDPHGVPGIVIFHVMEQRRLLRFWQGKGDVLRFTVSDLEALLEALEGKKDLPFTQTERVFAVWPLQVRKEQVEGLKVQVHDHRSSTGPVRRFTVDFNFAALGDLLIVEDINSNRLANEDGVGCTSLAFRVGPDRIEPCARDLPVPDEREMVWAALKVMEAGYETLDQPETEDPKRALVSLVAAWANQPGLYAEDVERRPLLPLWGLAYASLSRHAPAIAQKIDFAAFEHDPGVLASSFLTPAVPVAAATSAYRRDDAESPFLSIRLANQLGVLDQVMSPTTIEEDIQAADRLTAPRNRELWEIAANLGVRINIGGAETDPFMRQLKAFLGWRDNADIYDELVNTDNVEVGKAFSAYLDEKHPYQRPLDAAEFERLFARVQPIAIEVERARSVIGGGAAASPATTRDPRSTEQLKRDLAKLLNEGAAHADPKIRSIARRHLEGDYTLRKLMREAEKELKTLIGSPAIGHEILALVDWLEDWSGVETVSVASTRAQTDRRQRILDLSRAFRKRSGLVDAPPSSQLGRAMEPAMGFVESECSRFRSSAAAEDGDLLSNLPNYARILGFHLAHRTLISARAKGGDPPETASRLLTLWPERASDCWDRHLSWATSRGQGVAEILKKPWTLPPRATDTKPNGPSGGGAIARSGHFE